MENLINFNKKCIKCKKDLDYITNRFNSCSNYNCIYYLENLPIDN